MASTMSDPEIQAELAKPGVMEALQGAMSNPASLMTKMNDPAIGPAIQKIMAKAT